MRKSVVMAALGTVVCLIAAPLNGASAAPLGAATVDALAVTTVANWQMNEPVGATVMGDSSGNNLNGSIVPSAELETGFTFDGATGYHWVRRAPNQPPAVPARVIQVPDNPLLDLTDASQTYTVEIRFRTKENFGNITQKGQATTKGGQFKIQNPQGRPSCLFNGSIGRVSTRSKVAINDNAWHILTCVRTPTRVTLMIDGVVNNWKNGSTGVINNSIPLTVGGKINCNQDNITCDYFSGDIDWLRVDKG